MTAALSESALQLALDAGGNLFIKSSILLAIGLAATRLTSNSPARRSAIWAVVVASLLALPAATILMPAIGWDVLEVKHGVFQAEYGKGPIRFPLGIWLVITWAAGALLCAVRMARDFRAALSLVARSATVDDQKLTRALHSAAAIVNCKRVPVLRQSNEISTAALVGWRAPVLLTPPRMAEWPEDEIVGVFCHELEHVRRNDWLALVAERAAAVIYWPNPLVHLAMKTSSAVREQAADDAVFRSSLSLEAYAARLIAIARGQKFDQHESVLAFATGPDIEARVRALFAAGNDRRPATHRMKLLAVAAAFPAMLLIASVNPWACVPSASASTQSCD